MKLSQNLFGRSKQQSVVFQQEGKTLAQYRHELLLKMAKRQFEKLHQLGLAVPVSLG